ncbi:MAG: tail fiber protein [Flavobacteriales bacterium]|nr:tail fiber protein [Flavobacteriales bacterium]
MKQLFTLSILFFTTSIFAQVGLGTDNPNARAVLHLFSPDKGLIIPTHNTGSIDAMTLSPIPPNGTMVYNTDSNEVYVFYNTKWHSMTPFEKEHGQLTTNKGRIRATKNAVSIKQLDATTVNAVDGNGIVPLGAILMWSGRVPPDGYVLCMGGGGAHTNHFTVPDLRGQFIVGFDSTNSEYNEPGNLSTAGGSTKKGGKVGGATSVSLDLTQIPRHTHGVNDPGHYHQYDRQAANGERSDDDDAETEGGLVNFNFSQSNSYSAYTGVTIQYSGGTGTAQVASNGANHENRPPYYTLAFIMRIK